MQALSPRSLNQPLERMRNFSGVHWHLMPGNHDHYRRNGLWDQLRRKGLPANVHVHTALESAIFEDESFALLPAPLHHRRMLNDPTVYMDEADLPDGLMRVGLAHGTVTGFGSDDKDVPNYIAPDRPARAGLSYLALGRLARPEEDQRPLLVQRHAGNRRLRRDRRRSSPFRGNRGAGSGAGGDAGWRPATIRGTVIRSRLAVGSISDHLAEKLRGMADDLDRVLIHLAVEGALSLEDRQYFQDEIVDGVSAAFCFMRVDDRRLFPRPHTRRP